MFFINIFFLIVYLPIVEVTAKGVRIREKGKIEPLKRAA